MQTCTTLPAPPLGACAAVPAAPAQQTQALRASHGAARAGSLFALALGLGLASACAVASSASAAPALTSLATPATPAVPAAPALSATTAPVATPVPARAATAAIPATAASIPLPEPVARALAAAQVPPEALALWVAPVAVGAPPQWAHRAQEPMNPASLLKLVTSFAALDMLGPGHVWRTEVLSSGSLSGGVLHGNLYLRGGGDPALVSEKLWLLLRRVHGLGIERIAGDIVLDRSAFGAVETDPAAFNDEPLRPYNAGPDALLINFRAQVFSFVPDPDAAVARIVAEPPLHGVQVPASVPLSAQPCGDWRASLRADFSQALRPQFGGSFPAACGPRNWPLAHPQPRRMSERAVRAMWQAVGGRLDGHVREGQTSAAATPRLSFDSPTLAEVVRDANKFSNNVMAQHLLLALSPAGSPATFEAARERLAQWWPQRVGARVPLPTVGNGSGLSRDGRASAEALGRLLQQAYASHAMPDLMASLPASGLDGTLRRSRMGAGLAHLKTGSLRDVFGLAGYVHRSDGQRLVLVAIVNHPQAHAARPALDALVQWAAAQARP